ncbi:MAG: helix-turn-helix transcriptional regulator [Ruminococcaceae bacterium]|nr:helix-turn-helix transcriptional regulator [Oscillospiraceae bacterium]
MIYVHLSRLLGERKMPQAELARITGIRPNTINDLYHGTAERVSLDHLDRICEAIGCTMEELLERKPNTMKRTGDDLILEPHGRRKPSA